MKNPRYIKSVNSILVRRFIGLSDMLFIQAFGLVSWRTVFRLQLIKISYMIIVNLKTKLIIRIKKEKLLNYIFYAR